MNDGLRLLIDLHRGGARQGPGGEAETRRALELAGLRGRAGLRIADLGCGTGASTCILADALDADILAIDLFAEFLETMRRRLAAQGLDRRVKPVRADMAHLPIAPASLDVIWSEGAVYNLGFERGVRAWRSNLKPGGVLAVSELTWLTAERPDALHHHWMREYPEAGCASEKIAVLERAGYALLGYFPLPPECWLDAYYLPLEARFDAFLARHGHSDAACAIVDGERHEIDLYRRHIPYVSYGFYVARRVT